jgi:hypothetical protein
LVREVISVSIALKVFAMSAAVLVFSGCKSDAVSSTEGAVAAAATGSTGTAKQTIQDPSLNNMTAYTVVVPANWHFQGVLEQGAGQCVPVPFPVFRVTSPDGLSFMERMPTMAWRWGTGPVAQQPASGCLPLTGPMPAQDFLKYLAETMKLTYAGPAAVPADENAAAQQGLQAAEASVAPKYAAEHLTPPVSTRELARANVTFQNGTFAMQGQLAVTVDCSETHFAGMKSILRGIPDRPESVVHQCQASTRYVTAPVNQFQSVVATWNAKGMGATGDMQWQQAWVNRNQQQANQAMAQIRAQTQAAMQASAQKFQHDMAVQQNMHDQFMATMQRGTDMSMARTADSMNARSTAASDWVDYSLDQKTVMDPGTGQVSKVSSAYNYTWVDSSGKTSFQTNDANANPNGTMQGTWTRQQTVHGNGTP